MESTDLISLTADIVAAHLSHNPVPGAELPALIASVHAALVGTTAPTAAEPVAQAPAVPIRASIRPDHLVCLEDGKKLKMLKRYLRTAYDMSPDAYRAKWGLPRDYPMVAPAYAERRRTLAHAIGLGRRSAADTGGADTGDAAPGTGAEPKAPRKRGRPTRSVDAGVSDKARGITAAKARAKAHLGMTVAGTDDETVAPGDEG